MNPSPSGRPAPRRAPSFDYDALYAAPPRREAPVYAFLRDGWNGALDGARKAIGDILTPVAAEPWGP